MSEQGASEKLMRQETMQLVSNQALMQSTLICTTKLNARYW